MESENIIIGKVNKKECYLNNGKYGHYLTYDGKNYKVPEWFPVDKFDIDVALLQKEKLNTKTKCLRCIVMNHQRKQLKQHKRMNQNLMEKKNYLN
jgi:hypothetical protein